MKRNSSSEEMYGDTKKPEEESKESEEALS